MIGVETRTSSPVRIVRDKETLQHVTVRGLFPCGEGAGMQVELFQQESMENGVRKR